MADLTVIIPALNEAATIERVVRNIRALPVKPDVLVIDNGSTDNTGALAYRAGAVVGIGSAKGKGNAVKSVLSHIGTPYVAMIDADDTYPAEAIMMLYAVRNKYDVIKGDRKYRQPGSMTSIHLIGNTLLSGLASLLYGVRVKDVCSGLWLFNSRAVRHMQIKSAGFTLEAELFARAVLAGYKMGEVPIPYFPRIDGSKAKLKMADGLKIGWFLVQQKLNGFS